MLRIQRSGNGELVFKLSGRIDKENVAELQAKTDALQQAWTEAAQAIYANASATSGAAGAQADYREMTSDHGHDAFLAEQAEPAFATLRPYRGHIGLRRKLSPMRDSLLSDLV